jgi:HPt (histidine-containing phosphotransfer) domain-containing protein
MAYRYINTGYLEMVSGGDREITSELIDIFCQQSEEFYEDMQALYKSESYIELGHIAHKAKSSVAIMGIESLAARLKHLELNAHSGDDLPGYLQIIDDFRHDTTMAIEELKEYLKGL